jgi:lysophospholipase L1-like esterase
MWSETRTIKLLRHIAFVIALLFAGILMAQSPSDPLIVPDNDVLDLSRNQVLLPGDQKAWDGFNEKLDKLFFDGEGQVNIVHIGGSHIQADAWTAQLRQRLQSVAPGTRAGRGFIFPYNMAGSNNPYWYEPTYTGKWSMSKNTVRADTSVLGLAGYSVTTHDTATNLRITFRGDLYPGYTFTRATVLHGSDSSFVVNATCHDTDVVITYATDVLAGRTVFEFSRPQDTLSLRIEQTDTLTQNRFTLYGILLETDDPGVYYHALGVNGAATWSWLRCQKLEEELALLKPDLVVFSIGINDAQDPDFNATRYERNYDELMRRARQANPDAAILLVTNSDSFRKRRYPVRNADDVRDVMMRLARKNGAGVWDLYGVMGGQGSIRLWQRRGLAKRDLIHFTRQGYTMVGDLMFTAIMRAYGDHISNADLTKPK